MNENQIIVKDTLKNTWNIDGLFNVIRMSRMYF